MLENDDRHRQRQEQRRYSSHRATQDHRYLSRVSRPTRLVGARQALLFDSIQEYCEYRRWRLEDHNLVSFTQIYTFALASAWLVQPNPDCGKCGDCSPENIFCLYSEAQIKMIDNADPIKTYDEDKKVRPLYPPTHH